MENPPGEPNGNGRPPAPHASDPPGEFEAPAEVVRERQRWLDHDPARPLEVRLVLRILDLAAKLAALDRREMSEADVKAARVAATSTPSGKPMDVIRGAKDSWIEASLRQADVFEREQFGDDEPNPLDRELPSEEAQPPPGDDEGPPF